MKKTLFTVAIVVTAALAGCHKNKPANNPGDMAGSGSAMAGSAAPMDGSAAPAGSAM